jgi:hypothetical protein
MVTASEKSISENRRYSQTIYPADRTGTDKARDAGNFLFLIHRKTINKTRYPNIKNPK